jgi:hypothetical protein
VRPGSITKVSVPLVLPQTRHPERSASQTYRVPQCLVARSRRACPERSRRNLGGAYLTHAVRSFSTTEPESENSGKDLSTQKVVRVAAPANHQKNLTAPPPKVNTTPYKRLLHPLQDRATSL